MKLFRVNRDQLHEDISKLVRSNAYVSRAVAKAAEEAEPLDVIAVASVMAARNEILMKEGFIFDGEALRAPWDAYLDEATNEYVFTQGEPESERVRDAMAGKPI